MNRYRDDCIVILIIGNGDESVAMLTDGTSPAGRSINVPFRCTSQNAFKRVEIKTSQVGPELKIASPTDLHAFLDCLTG